jgi:hypothetical protein
MAGEWEGTARQGGGPKSTPTRATIKVVSAGSAMNQPRMKARPGGPAGTLAFEFMDGTNLGPHPARMQALVLTMPDPDHQTQAWTFRAGGQDTTMTFDLRRTRG